MTSLMKQKQQMKQDILDEAKTTDETGHPSIVKNNRWNMISFKKQQQQVKHDILQDAKTREREFITNAILYNVYRGREEGCAWAKAARPDLTAPDLDSPAISGLDISGLTPMALNATPVPISRDHLAETTLWSTAFGSGFRAQTNRRCSHTGGGTRGQAPTVAKMSPTAPTGWSSRGIPMTRLRARPWTVTCRPRDQSRTTIVTQG